MKSKVWQYALADNSSLGRSSVADTSSVGSMLGNIAGTLICILGTHRIAGNEEADVCSTLAAATAESTQICKTCPRLEQRRSTARICDCLMTVRAIHPTSSWPIPIRKAFAQQLDLSVGPVCLNCGRKLHNINFVSAPNRKATTVQLTIHTDLGAHHRPGRHASAC